MRRPGIVALHAVITTNALHHAFTDAVQRLTYPKGTDSHDYKFSIANIEDYQSLSPAFRNRFLAASMHRLKASSEAESPLVARSRAALQRMSVTERRALKSMFSALCAELSKALLIR